MAIATPNFTDAAVDELIATRRDLHMHPELGFEEVRTSGIVAARLRALGIPVRDHVGTRTIAGSAGSDDGSTRSR